MIIDQATDSHLIYVGTRTVGDDNRDASLYVLRLYGHNLLHAYAEQGNEHRIWVAPIGASASAAIRTCGVAPYETRMVEDPDGNPVGVVTHTNTYRVFTYLAPRALRFAAQFYGSSPTG